MPDAPIPRHMLGRTDMNVTELSLGCVGIGGGRTTHADDDLGVRTFQHALQRGMNYADTSPLYGESERRIGVAFGRPAVARKVSISALNAVPIRAIAATIRPRRRAGSSKTASR